MYDVAPQRDQLADLMSWEFDEGVDFLGRGSSSKAWRVLVSPELQEVFTNFLQRNEIAYEMTVENMQPLLQKEKSDRINRRAKRSVFADEGVPSFENYLTFEEMEAYTMFLANEYPNLVKRDLLGFTVEGRQMIGVRVSSAAEFGKKPIIFIDSGVHAREWVGPHSALYFLTQLVTNATVSAELLEKVDFAFVPNANPDGKCVDSRAISLILSSRLLTSFDWSLESKTSIFRLQLGDDGKQAVAQESTVFQ